MSKSTKHPDHAARMVTHCLMMQRLTECIEKAIELHPEYDLNTLLGRAEMETFVASRVTRILLERGDAKNTPK